MKIIFEKTEEYIADMLKKVIAEVEKDYNTRIAKTQEIAFTNQKNSIHNSNQIVDTQNGLVEAYESTESNSESIIDIENALVEIYEMIEGSVE